MSTDDLRAKIAAAIYNACDDYTRKLMVRPDCPGASEVEGDGKPVCYVLADAVIRELCLHREDMNEWAVLANGFRGHRYVTHWEENDPSPVTKIRSAEKLGLTGDGE